MTSTYEKIATATASGSTASITFSSIASTYTDIVLISNAKATVAGTNLMFRLNSDSGSNYSATLLKGNGSTASSYRYSNGTDGRIGEYTNAQFGVYITNFQNYSNTTTYKTIVFRDGMATHITGATVGLWRNTAAITRIDLSPEFGANTFYTGSVFTLYGIKAA